MINNITIGQYIPGTSVIHRLDPRVKIMFTMLFVVLLFVAKGPVAYGLVILFTLSMIKLSEMKVRVVLRGLKPLIIVLVLTFVLHCFLTQGGEELLRWGPLTVYSEGVKFGFYMATRLMLLVSFTSLLTLTTSPIALTDGLEKLLNPFKRIGLPAHELAMMMTIALRFIPTLLEEAQKIMKAQQARGADFESGSLMQRVRALLPLMVPLFISAFRRADDLAIAMEARCYRGGNGRTRMKVLTVTKIDFIAITMMLIFTVGIIYLRVVEL